MKHWSDKLPKDACQAAVEWCRTQPSAQVAWRACDNPRWMLWLIFRVAGKFGTASRRRACRVLAACVKPVLKCVPKNEKRPAAAIRLIEKYARGGKVTREELGDAAEAADAYAAYDAAADAAAYAADAAAYAAYAAYDAAADAAYAAYAAAAYAAAAYAAAAYAAADAAYAATPGKGAAQCKTIRRLMPAMPTRG